MTWDGVAKVLDVECALEAGSEEATEGCDERSEGGHEERVDLERRIGDGRREDRTERTSDCVFTPYEDRVELALNVGEDVCAEVTSRADHVVETHEEGAPLVVSYEEWGTYSQTKDQGADEGTDETLHRLFRTQLDERGASERLSANVGHDVVADYQRSGDEEPDQAFENVVDDEVTRDDNHQQGHVDPTEEGKLLTKVLLLEVGDETDKADDVEHESDEAVVLGKWQEVGIDKDNVLEVVDDGLAVKEVVGDDKEVPVESL